MSATDKNGPASLEAGSPASIDLGLGIACVLLGAGLFYGAKDYQPMLPGTLIGPRLLPSICAVVFMIFGAALSVSAFRKRRSGAPAVEPEDDGKGSPFFAAVLLGGLVLVILLIPYLGFIAASTLYAFAVTWAGRASWWRAALFSAVLTLLVYYLFSHIMRVPLPNGILF